MPDYQDKKSIDLNRVKLLLAALLNYDLDVPAFIRYLGGNYTGAYRDTELMLRTLKQSRCDSQIVSDPQNIFKVGCPMKMNASSTRNNFLDFQPHLNRS